jgi:hypothetical protein
LSLALSPFRFLAPDCEPAGYTDDQRNPDAWLTAKDADEN